MEANKLFLQNYSNEGDCAQLHKFAKTIEKEFKKTGQRKSIKYYPWAVIERIFRSQGGKVDVVNWSMKVELQGKDLLPNENGELVLQQTTSNALFIHLHGTWQGQEEHEYYPIFDNQSAKIIKLPDALDLNTAKQRGMVRLIARLSGIGLEIFEQQEGQFEEDKDSESAISIKAKKTSNFDVVFQDSTQPAMRQQSREMFENLIKGETTAKVETPQPKKVEVVPQPAKVEVAPEEQKLTSDTQEFADLLLEVRKVIREKSAQAKAKEFLTKKGKELLSQLTYEQLKELQKSL
jgi:hypothetical protein